MPLPADVHGSVALQARAHREQLGSDGFSRGQPALLHRTHADVDHQRAEHGAVGKICSVSHHRTANVSDLTVAKGGRCAFHAASRHVLDGSPGAGRRRESDVGQHEICEDFTAFATLVVAF